LATFSFHETKNYSAGEGGALICNVPEWELRAHFLQEKGTDRRLVLNGMKNKYSWVDKGSSYLLSDVLAAMLLAQLENESVIKSKRTQITNAYADLFQPYYEKGLIGIMQPTEDDILNHHAYWVLFDTSENRQRFMDECRKFDIYAYIGYMPLHSAPYGIELGYKPEDLPLTESIGTRITRLPYYTGMADEGLEYTIQHMKEVMTMIYGF
jgi:dTDP-4-amino-4,6-dideoxygalactose transaminase